jgi:hypothetical protein
MFLKKVDLGWEQDDEAVCSVLLTALPNHTQEEVLSLLPQLGANQIEELSPKFISAEVKKSVIPQLEEIARVEIKHSYQMR